MDNVLVRPLEIGKEVEGTGDKDGAELAGSTKSALRVRIAFDTVEVRFGAAGEFLLWKGTGARRRGRDQRPPRRPSRSSIASTSLSPRIDATTTQSRSGKRSAW